MIILPGTESATKKIKKCRFLRAVKDILTLIDVARSVCLDGRRALIIDEKYLGRDKKVSCFSRVAFREFAL